MTVAEIIADLDDHGFEDTSEERKLAVINQTYWDVCGREAWPFLEKSTTLTFTGSSAVPVELTATATLTDLHAVVSLDRASGGALGYMDYDDIRKAYGTQLTQTGSPRYFYFVGSELRFYPVPTADVTVTLFYIMTPPALAADDVESAIVLPKQYARAILVNGALVKLYAMEDDLDIGAGFKQFFDETMATMRDWIWRRQYTQAFIIVPADIDDMDVDPTWIGT